MILAESFYGKRLPAQDKIEAILRKSPLKKRKEEPACLKQLLGPSLTWTIFRKQEEALQCAKNGTGLMSFAFETEDGTRAFLACHPLRLWYQHENWTNRQKCTYEIIPGGLRCKLYLDLEYEYLYNPCANYVEGEQMLNTYLELLMAILKTHVGVSCTRENFIDLDSSTALKFSRHIILDVADVAFDNNYSVGNIVKDLSCKIIESAAKDSDLFNISVERIKKLFVKDRKDQRKLFVDTSVYTKNRHFRMLGSTKLHKNSPLVVSENNIYVPKCQEEYSMFLSSLVTFFETEPSSLVSYGQSTGKPLNISDAFASPHTKKLTTCVNMSGSLMSGSLDAFIAKVVSPDGRIRTKLVPTTHVIKYEIAGFRFCYNIGREHRSNNISIIVDLQRYVYYQTCYDPDCSGFTSQFFRLPSNVIFDLSSENENFLAAAVDASYFAQDCAFSNFYGDDVNDLFELSNDISDEDLLNITTCAEDTWALLQED